MAEMDVSSGGGHKKGPGVKKGKKLSTRVDLTPMVDLGFLLITFFMYTTTMSKPKTMEINMPNNEKVEEKDQTKVKESVAMTVLLSKDHRIYYYEGLATDPTKPPELKVTYFKPKGGIRDAIIDKKKSVDELRQKGVLSGKDQLTVLIKPDTNSTYDDLVNILDEMAINDVKVYAIVDITPVDQEFIHITESANQGTTQK
ncbi:MAG: biopolymer transporter ExbD [Bacteroidetes bacterium]|nr:biopolymer transporter ExbD [Bacteroidota bacterium]MBS1739473.1 biopolymer transporter ExbD [Bacteroidota bacterium]MBS1775032.1 biopolymer transporter ExbD [Bacteroidota bacterium]